MLSLMPYRETSYSLLQVLHLLHQQTHLLVGGRVPCARFHVPPRATGEDAVGKLSTERARELAFVDRKPLEDLVVLSGAKQNKT